VTTFELRRLIGRSFGARVRIGLPAFSEEEQDGLSRSARRMIALYHTARRWPIVRWLLLVIAPILQVVCFADQSVHNDQG
jgi:hypothetical protein